MVAVGGRAKEKELLLYKNKSYLFKAKLGNAIQMVEADAGFLIKIRNHTTAIMFHMHDLSNKVSLESDLMGIKDKKRELVLFLEIKGQKKYIAYVN